MDHHLHVCPATTHQYDCSVVFFAAVFVEWDFPASTASKISMSAPHSLASMAELVKT